MAQLRRLAFSGQANSEGAMERIADPREMEAVASLLWLETSEDASSALRMTKSDLSNGSGGSGGAAGSRRVLAPLPLPFGLACMKQRTEKGSFIQRQPQNMRKASHKSRSGRKIQGQMRVDKVRTQRGTGFLRESAASQLLPSITDLFGDAGESDGSGSKSVSLSGLHGDSKPEFVDTEKPKRDGLHGKRSREPCTFHSQRLDGSDTESGENRSPALLALRHDAGTDPAHPAASSPLPSSLDEEVEDLQAARAAFSKRIFFREPTTPRGFVSCLLCRKHCWAPNGRYHVDTCTAVLDARRARREFVGDMHIPLPPEAAFTRSATPSRRPGKIPGFVVADAAPGKGYVECLVCSQLVWAPNSARHRLNCKMNIAEGRLARENGAHAKESNSNSKWTSPSTDTGSVPDLFCYETLSD